jgi:hypothetical protein
MRLARRDVLAALKADAGVLGLVDADDIHPQQPATAPSWPFIKTTAPQGLPLRAACVRGATVNFGVSAFTRGLEDVTAESHAALIGDAIEKCLDGRRAELMGVGRVAYSIGDVLLRVDGAEAGAFHYSASISARVLA